MTFEIDQRGQYSRLVVEIASNLGFEPGSQLLIPFYVNPGIDHDLDLCRKMLFNAFRSKLVESKDLASEGFVTNITIELDNYLSACETENIGCEAARKYLKIFLDMLYGASIEWEEKGRKRQKDFSKQRLCTSVSIKKDFIGVSFCKTFVELLLNSPVIDNTFAE